MMESSPGPPMSPRLLTLIRLPPPSLISVSVSTVSSTYKLLSSSKSSVTSSLSSMSSSDLTEDGLVLVDTPLSFRSLQVLVSLLSLRLLAPGLVGPPLPRPFGVEEAAGTGEAGTEVWPPVTSEIASSGSETSAWLSFWLQLPFSAKPLIWRSSAVLRKEVRSVWATLTSPM